MAKKMQWLIDIIKEWVQDQGYLTTSFVDRGEYLAYDWTTVNFIHDNAWHDLDISAIVPNSASAVLMGVTVSHAFIARRILFRRKNDVLNLNLSRCSTVLAGISQSFDIVVPVDVTGLIEYRASIDPWFIINVGVKGWWL